MNSRKRSAGSRTRKPHQFPEVQYDFPLNNGEVDQLSYVESQIVNGFTDNKQLTYSGHISVRGLPDAKIFYVLHSPVSEKGSPSLDGDNPIIFWFQGGPICLSSWYGAQGAKGTAGPGCSSLFGSLLEVGPIKLTGFDKNTSSPKYEKRVDHWAVDKYLVFVDQPLGVGYSVAGSAKEQTADKAATDIIDFLKRFFEIYPKLAANPVFFAGEEFATRVITDVAYHIQNDQKVQIQIGGLILGAPWIDPVNQLPYYDYYMYAAGVVAAEGRHFLTETQNYGILNCLNSNFEEAALDLATCRDMALIYDRGVNIRNVRQYNYQLDKDSGISDWGNDAKTKAQFNVPADVNFTLANIDLAVKFAYDSMTPLGNTLSTLIGSVPILFYSGQFDGWIPSPGVNNMISNLNMPRNQDLRQVPKRRWRLNGRTYGTITNTGMTFYAIAYGAGHHVALDQPHLALDMINHFIQQDMLWETDQPIPKNATTTNSTNTKKVEKQSK